MAEQPPQPADPADLHQEEPPADAQEEPPADAQDHDEEEPPAAQAN